MEVKWGSGAKGRAVSQDTVSSVVEILQWDGRHR